MVKYFPNLVIACIVDLFTFFRKSEAAEMLRSISNFWNVIFFNFTGDSSRTWKPHWNGLLQYNQHRTVEVRKPVRCYPLHCNHVILDLAYVSFLMARKCFESFTRSNFSDSSFPQGKEWPATLDTFLAMTSWRQRLCHQAMVSVAIDQPWTE